MTNLASIITLIIPVTYRNNDFTFRTAKTKVILRNIPRERNDRVMQHDTVIQYDRLIHINCNETGNDDPMCFRYEGWRMDQGWSSRLISSCLRKEHLHLDPVHLLSQLDVVQGCLQAVLQALLSDPQYARVRWWTVMDGDGWCWMVMDGDGWCDKHLYFTDVCPTRIQFDSSICIKIPATSLCSGPFAATTSRFSWGPPAFWCLIAVGPQWCISRWLLR